MLFNFKTTTMACLAVATCTLLPAPALADDVASEAGPSSSTAAKPGMPGSKPMGVKRFNIHSHMMTQHPWEDEYEGRVRTARNAHKLGIETDEHRRILREHRDLFGFTYEVDHRIVKKYDEAPGEIGRLKADGPMDEALPLFESPGAAVGFDEASSEFWAGVNSEGNPVPVNDRNPNAFWEVTVSRDWFG